MISCKVSKYKEPLLRLTMFSARFLNFRDREQLQNLGGTVSDSILKGGGDKTLFLTNSYNFKKCWGWGARAPHPPWFMVPEFWAFLSLTFL